MLTHICWVRALSACVRKRREREKKNKTDLPECAQTSQNATADPGRVLALGRRKNLYPHVLDGHALHLAQQTVTEALGQCAATRQHNVGVQILAQVQVGAIDRIDHDLVHTWVLEADDLRIEEDLRGAEALGADLHAKEC
mgnify:CR=1 FL=1